MAKYSLEQLRSKVWTTREQAAKDLKSSGIKQRGADYELQEHAPGSWQLIAFDDEPVTPPPVVELFPEAPPRKAAAKASRQASGEQAASDARLAQLDASPSREQAVIDSLRKQPGAKPRGEAIVIVDAKAPAVTKTKPKVAKVNGKEPQLAKVPNIASKEADVSEKPPVVPDTPKQEPNDLSPLPKEAGPYELVIRSGEGGWPATAEASHWALEYATRLRVVVHVRNAAGEIVRSIDAARIKAQRKASADARAPSTRGGPRDAAKPSKFTRAATLLFRKEGATAAELTAAADWGPTGRRHVNRASKLNGDAKIEELGKNHWRLIKP